MKLAAVFNIWSDCACLLPYAIENIRPFVDGIIVVWSKKSNRGNMAIYDLPENCILVQCEPFTSQAQSNELHKRNVGLEAVKKHKFSHFIFLDGDEFYTEKEFIAGKNYVINNNLEGSVCKVKTYFKSPCLTIGYDYTYVPFIHKVRSSLQYKLGYANYPFTYHGGGKNGARIDPTRRLNIHKGVELLDITMHHYSYVRKNMALKLENSSANFKGDRSAVLLEDLNNAKPGYLCKSYGKVLQECENFFNIPEYE